MNKKEAGIIRRRLNSERASCDCIRGCYVNEKHEIISEFELPLSLFPQDETDRYLAIFKKVLSGSFGKNLINVNFTTHQVSDGEEHKLLMNLRSGGIKDNDTVKALYNKILPNLTTDEKCAVLLMHDTYDIPHKSSDGDEGGGADSNDMFSYMLCAVCPVVERDAGLCYSSEHGEFRTRANEYVLSAPDFGFMFPAYEDRCANIYTALYYTKSAGGKNAVTDAVFGVDLPMAADEQKTTFREVLCGSLESECTYDVVSSVREHICTVLDDYKEKKEADEAPVITKTEISGVLKECSVSEEKIKAFESEYEESFGKGVSLEPANVFDPKKFEVKTPDVTVKVSPDRGDLIDVRIIDGARYVLIRIEDGVEVNGIDVKINKE